MVPFLELCHNMTTADIDVFSFFLKEGVDPNVCDKVSNVYVVVIILVAVIITAVICITAC